jgi:hypothetical protein
LLETLRAARRAEIESPTLVLNFCRGLTGIDGHAADRIALHVLFCAYFIGSLRHFVTLPSAQVRVDQFEQLVVHRLRFLFFPATQSFGGAMMQVIAHQISRDATQGFLHAGDLRDDVGAIAVVFHHFLQSANLAFDAAKAMAIGGFNFGIDSGGSASRMYVASAIRVRWM